MKLYFAPRSRAIRSAWLLYEMALDFELIRFDSITDPKLRAPEFLSISPNGRIPLLEDDGVHIFESAAIAEYLVARHGNGRFAPAPASPDFPAYLQWLHYGEGMIMGALNNYAVETRILPPEKRSETHAKRALKMMTRMVQAVDQHMDGRDYLAGDFSAADTITGHACLACREFGVDMSQMPNLLAYTDRLAARPALQKAMAL